jgi:hypothetical protein
MVAVEGLGTSQIQSRRLRVNPAQIAHLPW